MTPFRFLPPLAMSAAALAAAPLAGQVCPAPGGGQPTPAATVRYLADDALEGRLAGSPGERCAGEFIARAFSALGLRPGGDAGTYFQSLPLASAANPHAPAGTGRNVIAIVEGADPALRGEAVVIGAHYDHLGHGGAGSLAPDQPGAIHNGADDNASGVAVLLELARRMAAADPPARTVVFVAFTGEEQGLLGSSHFIQHAPVPAGGVRAMLNMDMVGRLGAGPLIVYGTGTADEWNALLAPAARDAGVELAPRTDGFGPSDHTSFYARGIPVLHFFTNAHADYHRPSDDWERVDVPGMDRVRRVVEHVARALAASGQMVTPRRGAGAPPAPSGGGGYGPYLGTVPDFAPVERGVKLSGVRPGSPAEQAGLRAGDVIVRFGDHEVGDLQQYTDALRAHQPGDRVLITVRRDGQPVTVTAVLGRRGG